MFKILSLFAVVIQFLPSNGLITEEHNDRFKGLIEEDFAAHFEIQTISKGFGLEAVWKAKLTEKFGYHVAIEKKSVDLAYCSGAVLEDGGVQIIITAARCVEGHSADDLKIRYNTAEREEGGSLMDVKDVYVPFGSSDPRYAIAIVYPATKIPDIKGVLRFPSKQNTYENDAVVTGWPILYPSHEHSNLLLYTKQPLLSESACGTRRGFLCAGVSSNKTSYCHVTTGSPLVATKKDDTQKYLLGFLLTDKGCRSEITPTPYLDLALLENYKQHFFNH